MLSSISKIHYCSMCQQNLSLFILCFLCCDLCTLLSERPVKMFYLLSDLQNYISCCFCIVDFIQMTKNASVPKLKEEEHLLFTYNSFFTFLNNIHSVAVVLTSFRKKSMQLRVYQYPDYIIFPHMSKMIIPLCSSQQSEPVFSVDICIIKDMRLSLASQIIIISNCSAKTDTQVYRIHNFSDFEISLTSL